MAGPAPQRPDWNRFGNPFPGTGNEIAQAVLLLVSNGYITGQTIAVNGGAIFS
jgi:NAD(P)-dependent dehydrogenase (short-subunit alcohol dehydrogenase family)